MDSLLSRVDKYLKPVTLTDDQKSKLDALKKEYEPKFKETYTKEKRLEPRNRRRHATRPEGGKGGRKEGPGSQGGRR